jgi:hypothetical protein
LPVLPELQDAEKLLQVYRESCKSHPAQADRVLPRIQRGEAMLRILKVGCIQWRSGTGRGGADGAAALHVPLM